MVIAYAMPAFSYWLMRRQRQLPWVGLPNILCAPAQWLRRLPGVAARAHADAADAPSPKNSVKIRRGIENGPSWRG